MAWWRKFTQEQQEPERIVRTKEVDLRDVSQVKTVSVKRLNESDKEVIRKIERELLSAGVLAPRGEKIEIADRMDDILRIAAEQGLKNVQELVGDPELDARISAGGHSSGNLMLDDFDELEDTVYDVYEDTDFESPHISVKADGDNGAVALRLPDGTTIFGKVPGNS